MIGRGYLRTRPDEDVEASGFDAFELRLGDLMRGERATMGKSLIDVQRELKIKAAYIAAIENADPSAFDTPGFIAGYVRSYARYLNMDPDWAFETFCEESGFATAHGMSAAASVLRPERQDKVASSGLGKEIFSATNTPFLPVPSGMLANVEPRAVGSVMVLLALLTGLGYGGWLVLREVQKVTFAPVEQAPTVIADVDPLAGGARDDAGSEDMAAMQVPSPEALDRLYRPGALEVPVLVPRDGPIAALDPAIMGSPATPAVVAAAPLPGGARPDAATIASAAVPPTVATTGVDAVLASVVGAAPAPVPVPGEVRVTVGPAPAVQLVAVRESWVRVRAADGTTLFEGILAAGDTFDVPQGAEPATLRTGESGALYMALNGVPYGPVGPNGSVSNKVPLSAATIAATYAVADLAQDSDLAELVAVASAQSVSPADLPAGQVLPAGATQAPATGPIVLAD